MLHKPVAGEPCDFLKRARFFKQMRGPGDRRLGLCEIDPGAVRYLWPSDCRATQMDLLLPLPATRPISGRLPPRGSLPVFQARVMPGPHGRWMAPWIKVLALSCGRADRQSMRPFPDTLSDAVTHCHSSGEQVNVQQAAPAVDMGEGFRYSHSPANGRSPKTDRHRLTPYAACPKTRISETTLGQQQ